MRNIKINEEQDKEIRNLIKENMLNANTAVDGGVKTPDGGSAKIDYTSGNQNDSPQTQLTKAANVQDNMKVNGVNTPVETEIKVNGNQERSVTVGDKVTENKRESIIISKKQLDEIRLKKLKENSEVVKIKNLIK